MTEHGSLTGTGWADWSQIMELVGDDRCLWTDLGRLHGCVDVPARLPVGATHLWSWRPGRWVRVRVDGGRALATILTAGTEGLGSPVTFSRSPGIAWGNHSRAEPCHFDVTLVTIHGPAPIVFANASPRPPDPSDG